MDVYVLALLSAFAFALGTVLQQRGTLQTSATEGDPRFLVEIIRKPVWLLGGSLQVILAALLLGCGMEPGYVRLSKLPEPGKVQLLGAGRAAQSIGRLPD